MKYIRTKEELGILIENTDCEELQNKKRGVNDMLFKTWCGNDRNRIVAQADTIEELIDELVIHNPSNDGDFYPKHFVYQNKCETMLKPMSDYQKQKGIEIYGAIWTNKGLIYVAKMNDKGELELL